MGALQRLSTVVAPARLRAQSQTEYNRAFWSGNDIPEPWLGSLGGMVSPDLALTLSYVYCAVDTISGDFGTMTLQMFRDRGDAGRERVRFTDAGIGELARKLRWQPNTWQTAKAFWSTLAWQYLLRPAAYAEIIYRPGTRGFVAELIPRHPDRVEQGTLNGALAFRIREPNGQSRIVSQSEMFVVRNTSADGLNALSRIAYGAKALDAGLALQDFTKNYFRKGATASLIGTYTGEKEAEAEAALHASVTRYLSGVENAGGFLLVSDDINVKALGVEPEKAQLLGLKGYSGRDVARLFKMPPSWLGIEGAASYNSQVQDAANYVNRCLVPMVVEFEQAIQRDLIESDRFFAKFNMDYLLRADALSRMQAHAIAIRNRIMRPSEARLLEDLNPDPELDRLSEQDFRPGTTARPSGFPPAGGARVMLKTTLALHDQATRCIRRECAALEKLAKKHASDNDAWKAALEAFYTEHTGFVAETMRVQRDTVQGWLSRHHAAFAANGLSIADGDAGETWRTVEADELAALALDPTMFLP